MEFEAKEIPGGVPGVLVIRRAAAEDSRGWFVELFRASLLRRHGVTSGPSPQVSLSHSLPRVVRGIHSSPYPKLVTCLAGAVSDVLVDLRPESPAFGRVQHVELQAAAMNAVLCPAGVGHGFAVPAGAPGGATVLYVQGGEFDPAGELGVHPFDPGLGIRWPVAETEALVSAKDLAAPTLAAVGAALCARVRPRPCQFLVLGGGGYVGAQLVRHLVAMRASFVACPVLPEDREGVRSWLAGCRPAAVLCSAGELGHGPGECLGRTADAAVTGQLAVAEECRRLGVHCTLLLTGADAGAHPERPTRPAEEADPPSPEPTLASARLRTLQEALLAAGGFLRPPGDGGNVLALRVARPLSDDLHPESALGELLRAGQASSSRVPWTVLDELAPVVVQMAVRKHTGIFNAANPGTMAPEGLLRTYRELVDPAAAWEPTEDGRAPPAPLSPRKLFAAYPEASRLLRPVAEAVPAMCARAAVLRRD